MTNIFSLKKIKKAPKNNPVQGAASLPLKLKLREVFIFIEVGGLGVLITLY